MQPVSTPCVNICVIDDTSGTCRGCGRTLDEIAAWPTLTEDERQAVMRRLAAVTTLAV